MYLPRYHDLTISCSGGWRILKRLDMNRLPSSQRYKPHKQRWKRYEKQGPGHHVQVDVKFLTPIKDKNGKLRKHYQFTAIDDCTRVRVLRIYPRCGQKTAIAFIDYIEQRFPFKMDTIQTDNGPEFQTSFHWHVLDKGFLTNTPDRQLLDSMASSKNGRITTTTIDPTAALVGARHLKNYLT